MVNRKNKLPTEPVGFFAGATVAGLLESSKWIIIYEFDFIAERYGYNVYRKPSSERKWEKLYIPSHARFLLSNRAQKSGILHGSFISWDSFSVAQEILEMAKVYDSFENSRMVGYIPCLFSSVYQRICNNDAKLIHLEGDNRKVP